jgi:hypothetical protein
MNYGLWIIIAVLALLGVGVVFGAMKEHRYKEACVAKDGVWLSRDWTCVSKSSVIRVKP